MLKNVLHRLIVISCVLVSCFHHSYAIEASFTPAPDKDTGSTDGPLPLSQNQRNQLLQLDQQIAQSPNPQETLQKVAKSNGMSPDELGSMLMRNRRDMQMAGGGGGATGGVSNSLPRKMIRLLTTFCLLAFKKASAHPRSATMMGLLFLSTLYVLLSIPRTGIILSTGRGLFSSGHTTFLNPPTKYLSSYVTKIPLRSSMPEAVKPGSLSRLFSKEEEESIDGNTVKISKNKNKKLALSATAQREIPFGVLLPTEEELEMMHEKEIGHLTDDDEKKKIMEKVEIEAWDHAIDLAFISACRVLSKRRFSEFITTPSNRLRIYSKPAGDEYDEDVAVLVMKSMGDWKRFGIQPLHLTSEYENDDMKSVVYNTLKGGRFDGELQFSVRRKDTDDEEEASVVVTVTLLIPKRGRKIKDKVASKLLSLLAESIATSSVTEAKQILSRELQSTIHRGRARIRATEKRNIVFENMKKMEEMAEERRRKWQRGNPDAGRYRPTGNMMRSPGGGPGYSF